MCSTHNVVDVVDLSTGLMHALADYAAFVPQDS